MLSAVALLAAWSGYSAAKWGSESSLSLARASATRTQANRFEIEATQVRTLDAVKFNSAFAAYATGNTKLFKLAVDRFRPGYRTAFDAWVATHRLKNPHARPDPSDLPQSARICRRCDPSRAALVNRHTKEIAEHKKHAAALAKAATKTAGCRSSRRCCSRSWPSWPRIRATRRPSGARNPR